MRRHLAAALLAFAALPAAAQAPLATQVVGGLQVYVVQPGDFLTAIGARFGADTARLARDNALRNPDRIFPGQRLVIDNAHIVPAGLDDGVLINIPQRMLFLLRAGVVEAAYPAGLGRPDWPTPEGDFRIVQRETDKTWIVPQSIQEEMRAEGKDVVTEVPPGPDNPLGAHWLGLSLWGCGIHGTIAPSSVYHFRSHGCIRLHPDDIAALYEAVRPGTRGRIAYQPVLLARTADGRLLLEVHPDIYARGIDAAAQLRELATAHALTAAIDWTAADAALAEQAGLAREIGRVANEQPKETP